jgi:hypothetical protein
MNKYNHIKKKAMELRKIGMALDEIKTRLQVPRTTLYYWIKGTKIPQTEKQRACHFSTINTNRIIAKAKRDKAYNNGLEEYFELSKDETFKLFVMLYLTEGYRRNPNVVEICNSNPNLVKLGYKWIKRLANPERPFRFRLQIHIDNDESKLKQYWSKELHIKANKIVIMRKSNSGKLSKRQWRSVNGVMSIQCGDTYFRSRIQAYMDTIQNEW